MCTSPASLSRISAVKKAAKSAAEFRPDRQLLAGKPPSPAHDGGYRTSASCRSKKTAARHGERGGELVRIYRRVGSRHPVVPPFHRPAADIAEAFAARRRPKERTPALPMYCKGRRGRPRADRSVSRVARHRQCLSTVVVARGKSVHHSVSEARAHSRPTAHHRQFKEPFTLSLTRRIPPFLP
uniref:Uncharacterized protein n=1 Tax=Plectus sambesii TaxID=2011161 RepID=A0A914UM84_9BILA